MTPASLHTMIECPEKSTAAPRQQKDEVMRESRRRALVMAMAMATALGAADAATAAPEVYIPLGAANKVQIIDAATKRPIAVIEDVDNAHGLAITPDQRYLVVGSFAEVPAGSEDAPPRPAAVSQAEHEKHHAVPAASGATMASKSYVSIVDAASLRVVRRVAVRAAVHHVAVSPDGRFAVTTHPGAGGISVIDLETFTVARSVETGPAPNYAIFTTDASKLYVSNAGDDTVSEIAVYSWMVTRRIATGRSPEHVVLSPDNATLYVNNVGDGSASVIPLTGNSAVRIYQIGSAPHGIDLSDDGGTLFASSQGDGKLVAIDLASGQSRHIELAPAPYHVTSVPGSGTVFVSSRAENRIWVVDQSTLALRGEITIDGIGHQMAVAAR
jgi:YVTN family beta-propeller protein